MRSHEHYEKALRHAARAADLLPTAKQSAVAALAAGARADAEHDNGRLGLAV